MSGYLAIRCPECKNQFPTYFEECKYCGTDLREVEPTEYEPLDMTPSKSKPKKRSSIPRIKKPSCFGQHGSVICHDPELWPESKKKLICGFIDKCKKNPRGCE